MARRDQPVETVALEVTTRKLMNRTEVSSLKSFLLNLTRNDRLNGIHFPLDATTLRAALKTVKGKLAMWVSGSAMLFWNGFLGITEPGFV